MSIEEKRENESIESYELENENYKMLEKRIVRKCDIYLLPILAITYLLGVVDLSNIGNAIVAGFDYNYLKTTPFLFTLAISAHFLSYIIFEIPSNWVTRILGFHIWMPILMVCWAAMSMCQAACTTAIQLGIVRFLLGTFEAAYSPSIVGYVGLFYSKKEVTLRYSIFISSITIGGAFSGLASYFIVQISGTSLSGFQWLFIIENIPTILLALIIALFLTRDPGNARFLTPEEREFAVERLKPEGGPNQIDRSIAKAQIKLVFTDFLTYIHILLLLVTSIPANALNIYLPTLIYQLGFDNVQAQIMVIPPLLASTVFMIINSWTSDKYQTRTWNILVCYFLSIIGLTGMIATKANVPIGQYKRNTMTAVILLFPNIGGIIGILIFPVTDAPSFFMGNTVCLVSTLFGVMITIGLKFYFESINKKRDMAILANHNYKLNDSDLKNSKKIRNIAMKLVENEPIFDEVLCDRHPNWRYMT
ncbi:21847_t:CDS:2 [Cetraspora pellucida]|uniref:21847_t:CDS:1 n=1 Tax=Cetraspora pellucida TaxID=1433469 RepID=A0A9N9DCN1_9GLOM|nr:21847_t:CDS:2 [Cetraspora pellucida]